MTGLWILLLLIFIAALPVLPAYLWFRSRKFPMTSLWFLASLLAGAFSLLIAVVLQNIFPSIDTGNRIAGESAMGTLLFNIFIRIALTEETGRFLALLLFFWLISRFRIIALQAASPPGTRQNHLSFGAAIGLLTGLGFAIIETALYGVMNINIAILRAFTATPLHGACGARIGMAVIMFREAPNYALWRFLSAAAIHGMYNFMVISSGIPRVFPITIAFLSLFSSLRAITQSSQE